MSVGPEEVIVVIPQEDVVLTLTEASERRVAHHHVQGASSAEWFIAHGLDFHPNVTVIDSGGTMVEGEVEHLNMNELYVRFAAAFTGEAFLS